MLSMDIISLITCNGQIELWGVAIACVGLFVAGFVDSIAGGGGLISMPSFLIAGLPVHTCIATNKLSNCMGTAVATVKYIKEGFVRWRIALPAVVLALVGSTIGANASLLASEQVLRIVMLVIIPVAGFYVLRTKELGSGKDPWSERRTLLICCGAALLIGFYDGFYGPGTGTFLMLLLTGLGRLNITDAQGVTKAINLTTNLCALVVFLANGAPMIGLGLLCGCFNIAGNYLGANLFTERGSNIARPIMLVVLVIFAVRLIAEMAGLA